MKQKSNQYKKNFKILFLQYLLVSSVFVSESKLVELEIAQLFRLINVQQISVLTKLNFDYELQFNLIEENCIT